MIDKYTFIVISDEIKDEDTKIIYENIKKTKLVIVNYTENHKNQYFLILFEKTFLLIGKDYLQHYHDLFSFNPKLTFCFIDDKVNKTKILFNQYIQMEYEETEFDRSFEGEMRSFLEEQFRIGNKMKEAIRPIWRLFSRSLSTYLLKKAHNQLNQNRIRDFLLNQNSSSFQSQSHTQINENDIVKLKVIHNDYDYMVSLIYDLDKEKLFALKEFCYSCIESEKLYKREVENYQYLNHPFFPKFISKTRKGFIIEFIECKPLIEINKLNLNETDKLSIIFQIMLIVEFLHRNGFIYRTLSPSRIMIDKNKTVVLTDFDRMIRNEYNNEYHTKEFCSWFIDPLNYENDFSYESDIYSLGLIIYYIMTGNIPRDIYNCIDNKDKYLIEGYPQITDLVKKCIEKDLRKRPSIILLIQQFFSYFHSKINLDFNNLIKIYDRNIKSKNENNIIRELYKIIILQEVKMHKDANDIYFLTKIAELNDPEYIFLLGMIYLSGDNVEQDLKLSLHYLTLAANQNHPGAQYNLGLLFLKQNEIHKSTRFLSLAANQNDVKAQFQLGMIYLKQNEIHKSLRFLSLAANQNDSEAQFQLGMIYLKQNEIDKSLHYFSLAANQNVSEAQFQLGIIYLKKNEIDKSLHFLSLAANQNDVKAQYNLGLLYLKQNEINKSLHYLTLAANQNDPEAQFQLGIIYEKGELVERDMNKSLFYYSLASDQNLKEAHFRLGNIYKKGDLVAQDINKSINYFMLSANLNDSCSQYELGLIFYENKLIQRDILKSIHYFSLSAEQNHVGSQMILGQIYSEERYVRQDISNVIYYYSKASEQNNSEAQYQLGIIYYEGKYIQRDILKSIHYFSLSAEQNHVGSQLILGQIYSEEKYVCQDINNVIYYYSKASEQNNSEAQYQLGLIYYENKYIPQDLTQSIKYFTLAAKQNHQKSILYLNKIQNKYFFYLYLN